VRLQFEPTALAPAAAAAASAAAAAPAAEAAARPQRLDVSVALALRGLSLSLVHRERELIRAQLTDIDCLLARSDAAESAQLAVRDAQVDNQLVDAHSEVVLASRSAPVELPPRATDANGGDTAAPQPPDGAMAAGALWVSVARARGGAAPPAGVHAFESLAIAPGPFDLNIDEALLDELVAFAAALPLADLWQGEEWRRQRRADVSGGGDADSAAAAAAAAADVAAAASAHRGGGAAVGRLLAEALVADWAAAAHASAAGAAHAASSGATKLYVKRLFIGDLRANCTLTTAAGRGPNASQLQARRER
jgi:hypothetical protein